MNIFLSYSSAHRPTAELLALSLRGQGHTVFYDGSAIEPGGEYDERIREAIEDCDLFVFLISPESVAAGSYALAEVGMAEQRWSHPAGHVLPILIQHVPIKEIPPYLRAVSILKPSGDLVAESSAAVARMSRRRSVLLRPASILGVAVLLLLVWFGYSRIAQQQARSREVSNVVAAAKLDMDTGEYERAFDALGDGAARFPEDPTIRQMRSQAAMLWLRNIRVRVGERTFKDVIEIVRPVLSSDAAVASGAEAGDILAHLGWCQYLLTREGEEKDPITYFQRAVEADRSNPFAHAMWGFWILFRNGSLADATSHFDDAMASGRERPWVANLHIAALLNYGDPGEAEAIRVANMMRQEEIPVDEPDGLWRIYYSQLVTARTADAFLNGLTAGSQAATFQWLYPVASVREDRVPLYRFMVGRLQEFDGKRDEALAAYRSLAMDLQESNATGSLMDRTVEGIRRLTNTIN